MAIEPFIPSTPTVEDCWRGVILYGRNTASYKFALAQALLKLRPESGQLVRLEELAPHFANSIAEHLAVAPKQITTRNGRFIQACLAFNEDQDHDRLVRATVAQGFANVIDAFHVVGSAAVHHQFYTEIDAFQARATLDEIDHRIRPGYDSTFRMPRRRSRRRAKKKFF